MPEIVKVKVLCKKCWKFHQYEIDQPHPQMVGAWFICPTAMKAFKGDEARSKYLAEFTVIGKGQSEVIPASKELIHD